MRNHFLYTHYYIGWAVGLPAFMHTFIPLPSKKKKEKKKDQPFQEFYLRSLGSLELTLAQLKEIGQLLHKVKELMHDMVMQFKPLLSF